MNGLRIIFMLFFLTIYLSGTGFAQEIYVFPAKGQSQQQMEKDKYACYEWAKKTKRFDPIQTPRASAPPPAQEAPRGGLLRGAARGAAIGAVAGEIGNDDAGKGAKVCAATGALIVSN